MCILLSSFSFAETIVYEKPDIDIIVNGEKISVTDVPIIINSRTLIPLRTLLVSLGVPDNDTNIQWIGEKRQVKVIYEDINIRLDIDSDIAYINGQAQKLDSPATIYKSRTYLPAKFVGEALGYGVFWDSYNPAVIVTKNERYEQNAEVFSAVNDALQNIGSYETELVTETLVTVHGSDITDYKKKVTHQKVDLYRNLMEEQVSDGDSASSVNYYSDSTTTSIYNKKKFLDFRIDEALYSSLDYINLVEEDKYCIYSISNNEALLNLLAESGLYFNMLDGYGKVKEMFVALYIDKSLFYPTGIKIEIEREVTGCEEYGVNNTITETSIFSADIVCEKELTIDIQ